MWIPCRKFGHLLVYEFGWFLTGLFLYVKQSYTCLWLVTSKKPYFFFSNPPPSCKFDIVVGICIQKFSILYDVIWFIDVSTNTCLNASVLLYVHQISIKPPWNLHNVYGLTNSRSIWFWIINCWNQTKLQQNKIIINNNNLHTRVKQSPYKRIFCTKDLICLVKLPKWIIKRKQSNGIKWKKPKKDTVLCSISKICMQDIWTAI